MERRSNFVTCIEKENCGLKISVSIRTNLWDESKI